MNFVSNVCTVYSLKFLIRAFYNSCCNLNTITVVIYYYLRPIFLLFYKQLFLATVFFWEPIVKWYYFIVLGALFNCPPILTMAHWLDYRRMGRYSIYSSKLVSYNIIVPHYHVNVTHNGKYHNNTYLDLYHDYHLYVLY